MLRRRIFSSAMASVMALSSIAVVANAEETTAYVKTKADLEKLITETYGDDFRLDGLDEVSASSAENMLDALEAADRILENPDSTTKDYTVAYAMVEAAYSRLRKYDKQDLLDAMAKAKPILERGNILNEELGDLRYTDTSFEALEDAYNDAELVIDSTAINECLDALDALEGALKGLTPMDQISKSNFRNVMKEYEQIIAKANAYDYWRLGTITDWATLNFYSDYWTLQSAQMPYGVLVDSLLATKTTINEMYNKIDSIKGLSKTSDDEIVTAYKGAQDAVAIFKTWKADNVKKSTKSGIKSLLNEYHGMLVADFNATSVSDLAQAIDAKVTAAGGTVEYLGNGGNMYYNWNIGGAWVNAAAGTSDDGNNDNNGIWKQPALYAESVIKADAKIFIPITEAGYWDVKGTVYVGEAPADYASDKYKTINKGIKCDLADLIEVTSDMVASALEDGTVVLPDKTKDEYFNLPGNALEPILERVFEKPEKITNVFPNGLMDDLSDTVSVYTTANTEIAVADMDYTANLAKALELAEDYLAGNHEGSDVLSIDSTGIVATTPKGTSSELALVYRYLKYALSAKYDAVASASETYTKADVKKLIDECYALADKTGDTAIFYAAHEEMVDARQIAIEWVRRAETDKLYKEYTGGIGADKIAYTDSTNAYKALKGTYDQLSKEYAALKYSFEEIYNKIASVYADIDEGKLDPSASLVTALDDTAYALSTVQDVIFGEGNEEFEDNAGFDGERYFLAVNRVITTEEAQEIKSLGAKIKAVADNKNSSHYRLKKAYEALLAAIEAQAAPAIEKGDANGDGKAYKLDDVLEVVKVYNKMKEAVVEVEVIDHNDNAAIDLADALAILKKYVGK